MHELAHHFGFDEAADPNALVIRAGQELKRGYTVVSCRNYPAIDCADYPYVDSSKPDFTVEHLQRAGICRRTSAASGAETPSHDETGKATNAR